MPLYTSLSRDANELRLVYIKPGRPGSQIECELKHVPHGEVSQYSEGAYNWITGRLFNIDRDLKKTNGRPIHWVPEYEALSYTWGEPGHTTMIKLNGTDMEVRQNLYDALSALRRMDKKRAMWIDALCINQDDIEEKNAQIPRMPAIYQRATRTIAWLGTSDRTALRAMDTLERLGGSKAHLDAFKAPKPMWWPGPQFDGFYGEDGDKFLFEYGTKHAMLEDLANLEDLAYEDWKALESFFYNRPYWRRMWVVQEIVNSRKVIFQCGGRKMNFETFIYLPHMRMTKHDEVTREQAAISVGAALDERFREILRAPISIVTHRLSAKHPIRAMGFEPHSSSLLNLLEEFRYFQCTDPRDRVYALLGLPSIDRDMPLPKPDYTKDFAEVYCETVKAIIQYSADLSVLCVPRGSSGVLSELPSWVPSWTETATETALFIHPREVWPKGPIIGAARETLPKSQDFDFGQPVGQDSVSSARTKKRPLMHSRSLMTRVGDCMETNGLTSRNFYSPIASNPNLRRLDLSGYVADDFMYMSAPIPENAFADGTWKEHILQWEELLHCFDVHIQFQGGIQKIDPGLRHPQLFSFLVVLMRGKILVKQELSAGSLADSYVEHYLVWTGRLDPSQSRCPILPEVLSLAFDNELKKSVRGWKFAMTTKQRLALVNGEASMQDKIAVLFGCDYPLLVFSHGTGSHNGERRNFWTLRGSTFVQDMMEGEVFDEAQRSGWEEERFLFI